MLERCEVPHESDRRCDMKKLGCSDLGDDCPFTVTAETGEEAKKVLYDHAFRIHAEKMAGLTDEQKAAADKQLETVLAAQ